MCVKLLCKSYKHRMPAPQLHRVLLPTQSFDVCVEASGSSQGIRLAAALTRSLGTIVLKSTCSTVGDDKAPSFAAIANDIVVQELTLVGSRCTMQQADAALQLVLARFMQLFLHKRGAGKCCMSAHPLACPPSNAPA